MIEVARDYGFKAEGIEPSSIAVDYARGRGNSVTQGYFGPGIVPPETYDVIVFQHVLEHVPDPDILLAGALEALKPGGSICVAQTNYRGTVPAVLRRRWPGWVAEEHFIHFTRKSLRHLLARNGFTVRAASSSTLGYFLYVALGGPRTMMTVANNTLAYFVSRWKIGLPFRGDQIYMLGQKPASSS